MLVAVVGFEPTRPFGQRLLRPPPVPVRIHRRSLGRFRLVAVEHHAVEDIVFAHQRRRKPGVRHHRLQDERARRRSRRRGLAPDRPPADAPLRRAPTGARVCRGATRRRCGSRAPARGRTGPGRRSIAARLVAVPATATISRGRSFSSRCVDAAVHRRSSLPPRRSHGPSAGLSARTARSPAASPMSTDRTASMFTTVPSADPRTSARGRARSSRRPRRPRATRSSQKP